MTEAPVCSLCYGSGWIPGVAEPEGPLDELPCPECKERFNGLSQVELNQLGTYNAERARGITHTAEWQQKMAELQQRFNAAERRRF